MPPSLFPAESEQQNIKYSKNCAHCRGQQQLLMSEVDKRCRSMTETQKTSCAMFGASDAALIRFCPSSNHSQSMLPPILPVFF